MKENTDFFKTFIILLLVISLTKAIDIFPWWAFTIPVIAVGIFINKKNYSVYYFPTGFICGFFLWIIGNLIFHMIYKGNLLARIDTFRALCALISSGLVGGILTGLGLYVGKLLVFKHNDNKL